MIIGLLRLSITFLACYKQYNEKSRGSCILQLNSKDSVELQMSRSMPSLCNYTFRTLCSTFLGDREGLL